MLLVQAIPGKRHRPHSLTVRTLTSPRLRSYMGYPIENLPSTMKTTDATFKAKDQAMNAYAPYDFNVCPNYQSCLSAGGSGPREAAWLLRQYVVTSALATHTGVTPSTGGK